MVPTINTLESLHMGHDLARIAPKMGIDIFDLSEEAIEALCHYEWPGNVRELYNILERALLLCEGEIITLNELPAGVRGINPPGVPFPIDDAPFPEDWRNKKWPDVRDDALSRIERTYLAMILRETGGRIGLTAQRAGIHPRGLYAKMRKYGLNKEDFKGH